MDEMYNLLSFTILASGGAFKTLSISLEVRQREGKYLWKGLEYEGTEEYSANFGNGNFDDKISAVVSKIDYEDYDYEYEDVEDSESDEFIVELNSYIYGEHNFLILGDDVHKLDDTDPIYVFKY